MPWGDLISILQLALAPSGLPSSCLRGLGAPSPLRGAPLLTPSSCLSPWKTPQTGGQGPYGGIPGLTPALSTTAVQSTLQRANLNERVSEKGRESSQPHRNATQLTPRVSTWRCSGYLPPATM